MEDQAITTFETSQQIAEDNSNQPVLAMDSASSQMNDVRQEEAAAKLAISSPQSQEIPAVDQSGAVREVMEAVRSLVDEMQSLRQGFEAKLQYDETKALQVKNLHEELKIHKEDLHFRILRPVFMDLINMYDDMSKSIESASGKAEDAPGQMIHNLEIFREAIEEILRRNGVETVVSEDDLFQASRQRSLRAVVTNDPALDKRIARRVRKGFVYENKLLRPEMVETYRYVSVSI